LHDGLLTIELAARLAGNRLQCLIPSNPIGRHTGAGRYPDDKKITREAGHHLVCLLCRMFTLLDTGLRRYDEVGLTGF
jgi:hypothetical protein